MGVPPLPTLFLLYIGYKVGGVLGMILAVPLGLLLFALYQDGAFDTTKNSLMILLAGINRFRTLGKEDMIEVEDMNLRNEEKARLAEKQRLEAEREKEQRRRERKQRKKK